MTKYDRFSPKGAYHCDLCGKLTRDTGHGEASINNGYCKLCLFACYMENSANDHGEDSPEFKSAQRDWIEAGGVRPIREIAADIVKAWPKPNYAAVPYLEAMHSLDKITDMYFADKASSIVLYFLTNASTFRGEDAKCIKAELKNLTKDFV